MGVHEAPAAVDGARRARGAGQRRGAVTSAALWAPGTSRGGNWQACGFICILVNWKINS